MREKGERKLINKERTKKEKRNTTNKTAKALNGTSVTIHVNISM